MSETDINRLKAKRRGHRGVTTKFIQEAKSIVENPEITTLNRSRLKILDNLLEEKEKLLRGMDDEMLSLCKVEEIEKEIEDADAIRTRILEIRGMIECLNTFTSQPSLSGNINAPPTQNTDMAEQQESISEQNVPLPTEEHPTSISVEPVEGAPSYPSSFTVTPKLPKLVLQKFNGEITKFRTFWDRFDSSVNKNPNISPIDKFNYLQGLLEGPAARVIQGLPLTEANYNVALNLLEERFGNTQHIISMHMDELLQLPTCLGNKPAELRLICDKVGVNVRGLESLGVTSDKYGSFLIPIIMSKLPPDVRLQIARVTTKDVWQIEEVLNVLKSEVQAREMSSNLKIRDPSTQPRQRMHTTGAFFAGDQNGSNIRCVFCDAEHFSASCEKIKDPQARKNILKRQGRCFLCLRKGHRINQCTSNRRCRKCPGKHHQSICEFNSSRPPQDPSSQPPENKPGQASTTGAVVNESSNGTTTTSVTRSQTRVLLQTARTYAYSNEGSEVLPVRVLIDTGSQRSYVTTGLQQKLGLKPIKKESLNLNTFGDAGFSKKDCDLVQLTLQGKNGQDIKIAALSFGNICSPLPGTVNLESYPSFLELDLADYNTASNSNDDIDVLIGSDYYWDVITGHVIRESNGLAAVSSKFGWLVSGPVQNTKNGDNHVTSNLILQQPSYSILNYEQPSNLTDSLARFWDSESIGIVDYTESDHQRKEFLKDIAFDKTEGKYQVDLPWKEEQSLQNSNFGLCVSRLHYLNSRLSKEGLLDQYDDIFKEQERTGIIERVPADEENNKDVHFLPHHGVVRSDKATTKLRIVFDGSAKDTDSEHSINNCLETGPNLTPHLFDVLIRFRSHPVALTADVEKAFHQISVSTSDRDKLRFLWWENIEDETPKMVQYRFRRLVFGLTSSPAILNGTIQHHLSLYASSEPEVSKLLASSLYVDDFPGGVTHEEAAFGVYEKAKRIMSEGGFNLRKWRTNSKVLKERIDKFENTVATNQQNVNQETSEHKSSEGELSKINLLADTSPELRAAEKLQEKSSEVKILGLNWNTERDCFSFDVVQLIEYLKSLPPTKRSILKASAKIFDPIGLISPITVNLKMWFQELCSSKVEWDEALEKKWLKRWTSLVGEVSALSEISVPRCYFQNNSEGTGELLSYDIHGFSDASEKAVAAVVYLLSKYANGTIDVRLIASKTRVAPLKKQSIPRLELLGAYLLAKLVFSIRSVLESLAFKFDVYYWVDSFTTLCWIKNNKPWRQYVQHRVNEIRRLSAKEKWRFCPGELNPADIPSRGCAVKELVNNKSWWNGPEFLKENPESWPKSATTNNELADKELLKHPPVVTSSLPCVSKNVSRVANLENIIDIERYSTKIKLLRVTAIVMRFVKLLKRKANVPTKHLTGDELRTAEIDWIKSVQACSFKTEQNALMNGGTACLHQFELQLDTNGLICCKGRLHNADVPESSKNPIILPSRHRFTELLIRERHEDIHHQGIRDTLNSIRQQYWILKGREAVKRVTRRCVVCKRHEGKSFPTPPMPDLPTNRVDDSPPFTNTGVDYAGPLYVTCDSKTNVKCYCCLFTCASTRAIHLELTRDLSALSFLQAFRRFTARRGLPAKLQSDNAKTFKASSVNIRKIMQAAEVKTDLANKQVVWDFIVEKAPWWGGYWERLVRSVKSCLKKSVGRSSLNFEELRTLMVEIECTLNNKPMTYVYADDEGLSYPLTPADLVYGRHIATTPNQRYSNVSSTYQTLTRRIKYHYRLLQNFTRQWRREYLLGLRESARKNSSVGRNSSDISVGEVVILKDDSTARCYWKLAKITELLEGKDGVVRAARITVLTAPGHGKTTILQRPIQHLIPLEVRCADTS